MNLFLRWQNDTLIKCIFTILILTVGNAFIYASDSTPDPEVKYYEVKRGPIDFNGKNIYLISIMAQYAPAKPLKNPKYILYDNYLVNYRIIDQEGKELYSTKRKVQSLEKSNEYGGWLEREMIDGVYILLTKGKNELLVIHLDEEPSAPGWSGTYDIVGFAKKGELRSLGSFSTDGRIEFREATGSEKVMNIDKVFSLDENNSFKITERADSFFIIKRAVLNKESNVFEIPTTKYYKVEAERDLEYAREALGEYGQKAVIYSSPDAKSQTREILITVDSRITFIEAVLDSEGSYWLHVAVDGASGWMAGWEKFQMLGLVPAG